MITYADGKPVYKQNAFFQVQTALNRGVDAFIIYGRKDLDADFVRRNQKILNHKPGAGCWLWKPYVILKTLKQIPEGDVLIYADSAITVRRPVFQVVNMLKKHDVVVFKDGGIPLKGMVKRDCIEGLRAPKSLLEKPSLWAGLVVMRNTQGVQDFIAKWLAYAQDPDIIMDTPSKRPEYPDFRFHHFDQGIFTLLVWMHRMSEKARPPKFFIWPTDRPRDNPSFYWHHQRGKRGSLMRLCPTP